MSHILNQGKNAREGPLFLKTKAVHSRVMHNTQKVK